MNKEKISINIIGSGIGSLFCGAILAKHGFKINIFEARLKYGGYATCWHRKDYLFDSSLHELNGFYPDDKKLRTFRFLDLFNKIKLINLNSSYYSIFKDYEIRVPHKFKEFMNKLISEFPEEEKNIKKVMNTIKNISIETSGFANEKTKFDAMKKSLIKYPYLTKHVFSTIHNFIWKKIKTPKLRTIIAQLLLYYSHDITKMNLIYFSAPTYTFINEAYWISGTSASLSKALKDIIEENGGEIHLRKKVTKINFLNKKAIGITVNNNETYFSDITLCNSPLKYTVENLIDKKNFPFFLRRKALKTKASMSIFSIYLGMKIDVRKIGMTEFCYMLNEIDDLKNINKNNKLVDHSLRPIVIAVFNLDNSLCPEGKTVINICIPDNIIHWNKYRHDNNTYKKEKNRITEIIFNRIEKRFPGFKENIEVMEIGTPLTMEKYSNNPEGAVYGACQTVFQGNLFRFPNEIKNKNLYFVGAWVSPGGGFSGAMISAIQVAEIILKKYNIYNKLNDFIHPKPSIDHEIY